MKILLVNTPYREAYGSLKKIAAVYFPIGLGYIASVLRQHGFDEVSIFDPEGERVEEKEIVKRIKKYDPDIIGLSGVTSTYPLAKKIAKSIRKSIPNVLLVMGGVHVSALPRETLEECPEVDLLIRGEGEYSFLEVCQNYKQNFQKRNNLSKIDNLSKIKGIVYRENGRKSGRIILNPGRELLHNLDRIPFPARDLVNMDNYFAPSHMNIGKKSVTIISSRGCPAQCTFCASWLVAGRRFRAHSAEYVVKEICHLKREYGFEHFIFEDDSFTINRKRVEEICLLILKRKLGIVWSCFGRVTTVDRPLLKLMKKAGCYLIGFGVESGNEEIIKRIKKGITKEQCRWVFSLCGELGIKTHGFFMIGNPGETEETIMETINFAIELDPTLAFFGPLVPYPGTKIYKNCCSTGLSPSKNWENYSAFGDHLALDLHEIPLDKLKYYCILANLRFYLRGNYIFKRLSDLSSLAELYSSIKGAFSLLSKYLS